MKQILVYILIFWQAIVFAQEPYTVLLQSQMGLPSDIVYNLSQDNNGYIWLATQEGLVKYDGFQFKVFRSNFQTSAAGSEIKHDKYGRVWYENFDGFIYYVENDEIQVFNQNAPSGYVNYGITDLHLFVIQKKGIDVFDLKTLKLIKTFVIDINELEHANTLNQEFYCIIDHIVYKIDKKLQLTTSSFFKDKKLKVKYVFPFKNKLYVVSKNNESNKLYFFDSNLQFLNSINIPSITYIQGSNVIDGVIWLHTPKGIYAFSDKGMTLFKKGLFTNSSTSDILKDHQSNLWISTLNQGVLIVPKLEDRVFGMEPYVPLKILDDKNSYIIGDKNGNLLLLNETFKIQTILKKDKENLPFNYIYKDTLSKITIFTGSGFSVALNNNFKKSINYNIALKEVTRLDDKYYAFAASGLCGLYLNPKANTSLVSKWDSIFKINQDKDLSQISRLKKAVRSKSLDYDLENERLLFATNIGLFEINPTKEQEILYNNQPVYAERVINCGPNFIILDSKRNLYKLLPNNEFVNLTNTWNLPLNDIRKIKKSNNNLILISSEFIYIYDILDDKINKIDFHIKGNRINDILLINKYLIALTNEGVIRLNLYSERKKPNVIFKINEVQINGIKKNFSKKIALDYNENDLKINFSILEYSEIKTPIYYRINKNEWILINSETRTLQFPSLSTGIYDIEFLLNDTIQQENINLEIVTPFWKKWWFYTLLTMTISVLLWLYFKWQYDLMKNQIQLLNEKVSLEKNLSKSMLASIKSQMNPHFFYNALNTIQAYIFTNNKIKANDYLAKFSKLTRNILELSEKETISLSEEIQTLNLYLELEKMRFSDSFIYNINTNNISDLESIEIPPMIIQPYVENAIKHGLLHRENEKKLKINFQIQTNILKVTIEDNGIGRKKSFELNKIKNTKHTSFSTQANAKRLEILNQGATNKIGVEILDKVNSHNEAVGTIVIIYIPVN